MDSGVCRCGHTNSAHEHYRPGSECALCGPEVCPRFRRKPWWVRLIPRKAAASELDDGFQRPTSDDTDSD